MSRRIFRACSPDQAVVLRRNVGRVVEFQGGWVRVFRANTLDWPGGRTGGEAVVEFLDEGPADVPLADEECERIVRALFWDAVRT